MHLYVCDVCDLYLGVGQCPMCVGARRGSPVFIQRIAAFDASWRDRQERLGKLGRSLNVGLVSCGSQKREGRHAAEDLYTGSLVRLGLAYSKATCDETFILSAKHGLLALSRTVENYEQSLHAAAPSERLKWADRVVMRLRSEYSTNLPVKLHGFAGETYVEPLRRAVDKQGLWSWSVEAPLRGMTLFDRMRWLRDQRASFSPCKPPSTAATAGRTVEARRGPMPGS